MRSDSRLPSSMGRDPMRRNLVLIGWADRLRGGVRRDLALECPEVPGPPGMVWIPGGEFTMGTDAESAWPEERPAHRVRVDGFWIDQTEVTNAQFRASSRRPDTSPRPRSRRRSRRS